MNSNDVEIERLSNWLVKQVKISLYSDLGIKLTIHGGKITRTEKMIVERKLCDHIEME